MTKPTEPQPTSYLERATAMRIKAGAAEIAQICKDYKEYSEAASEFEPLIIKFANKARTLGIRLQTWCGHETMELKFWTDHCEGKLPFKFNDAKTFTSIARKMPEPAKTLAEALTHVREALVAAHQLELIPRTEAQKASSVSEMQRFLNEVTSLNAPFKKVLQEKSMEEWAESELNDFLTETEWIEVERAKARLILKGCD